LSVSKLVTMLVCRSSKLKDKTSDELHLTSIELPASSLVASFDNVNPASNFVALPEARLPVSKLEKTDPRSWILENNNPQRIFFFYPESRIRFHIELRAL